MTSRLPTWGPLPWVMTTSTSCCEQVRDGGHRDLRGGDLVLGAGPPVGVRHGVAAEREQDPHASNLVTRRRRRHQQDSGQRDRAVRWQVLPTSAQRPPATRSVVPVTYDASSLISQAIASATSPGSPGAAERDRAGHPLEPAGLARVGVDRGADDAGRDARRPGRPRRRPPGRGRSVSASTPAFAAAYWTYSPGDPSVAAPELTLTSTPPASAVRRAERAHRGAGDQQRGGEVEVDGRAGSRRAGVSASGPMCSVAPALLTTPVSRPCSARGANSRSTPSGSVRSARTTGSGPGVLDREPALLGGARRRGRSRAPGRARRRRAAARSRRRCRGCRR